MAWSAARALLAAANPIASVEPIATGGRVTDWLKITVVPLLVFLIGACIWDCIQNNAAGRESTQDGGGSTRNEVLGEGPSDSPRAISNDEAAEGLELSRVRCRDEERDGSFESSACSVATNPAMDGNARANSDVGGRCG